MNKSEGSNSNDEDTTVVEFHGFGVVSLRFIHSSHEPDNKDKYSTLQLFKKKKPFSKPLLCARHCSRN